MAKTFTDANFQEEVLDAVEVVLVDFWAPWCGPCQMIGPIIEELAEEYEGKAKIGKVNVDESPETSGKYGIMSIPAIKIFKNGQVVDEVTGVTSKDVLKEKIEAQM